MSSSNLLECHRSDFQKVIELFGNTMLEKLMVHAPKKGGIETWPSFDIRYLAQRIREETIELEKSIESGDAAEAMREAADVANFAMMVHYWYHVHTLPGEESK